jgi:hypothetical protein
VGKEIWKVAHPRSLEDGIWVVSFLDSDLGYFDDEAKRVEPVADPFESKVLPMSPDRTFLRKIYLT